MRSFAVVVFVTALSCASQASFDLMYVADGASRQIHRVDPINRIALGTFGAGFLSNPISVALDAQNDVYVLDLVNPVSGRVRKFNGSTGAYLGGFAVPFSIGEGAKLRVNGNNIYYTSGDAFTTAYV